MLTYSLILALISAISWIRGSRFASVTARTPVRMFKDSPLTGKEIFTISQYTFFLNVSYENAVRAAGKRCGSNIATNFKVKPNSWGTHLHPNIVQHNESEALYFCGVERSRKIIGYEYADGTVLTPHEKEIVERFKMNYRSNAAEQGLPQEKAVIFRSLKFENILSFKCGSQKWSRE